jgi:DNA-binding transcriptional MerR regulator
VTQSSHPYHTAATTARRLGLTARALRIYERHGLVHPPRTAAGWRVYGPEEISVLHQVIALKQLGLSLAQIARLTRDKTVDLANVLALQEAELLRRRRQLDRALTYVREARKTIAQGGSPQMDDIVKLIKETRMSASELDPEFEALLAKHYDPERVKAIHTEWTPQKAAQFQKRKSELAAETERLKHTDPGSAEARDLVRRWQALVAELTQGDPQLTASIQAIYREGFAKPETARHMLFSLEAKRFLEEARARLAKAGE